MNVFFVGMCISMLAYTLVGAFISSRIKNEEDFYVAGRRAPVILVSGSFVASLLSVATFMGDSGLVYDGAFGPLIVSATVMAFGCLIGPVVFGRYLRRSRVLTIPEFFGVRFCSKTMQILAAVTSIIVVMIYLLSVMQGIGTLLTTVTGFSYRFCICIALICVTVMTVLSGSRGVLITDTIMALLFTAAMIISVFFISNASGGWFTTIKTLAQYPETAAYLSGTGKLGVVYDTPWENLLWGFDYGFIWVFVAMAGPWQASRYLMAKDENVVIRSGAVATVGTIITLFGLYMSAIMLRRIISTVSDSQTVLIWGAMNILPRFLGVVLLTGVLSAGISSATTFLSLIGSSVTTDILGTKSITVGRIVMLAASVIVLLSALYYPPSIFWVTFFSGSTIASAWGPVAVASIYSRQVTKTGALSGMLFGLLGCFSLKLYESLSGKNLPIYLDPSIIGMLCNIVAMTITSALTQVSDEEKEARGRLLVMPDSEKDPVEMKKTLRWVKCSIWIGVAVTAFLLLFWVIPYLWEK